MNTDDTEGKTMDEAALNDLTEKIIGAAFQVSNTLGCGYLEKVYENALAHELRKRGMQVQQQLPIPVYYDSVLVGDFYADLLVNEAVLIELKAVREFDRVFEAQCLNYLKGTDKRICLLMNFGKPRLEVKRYRR
jgi:GxxExxY protein